MSSREQRSRVEAGVVGESCSQSCDDKLVGAASDNDSCIDIVDVVSAKDSSDVRVVGCDARVVGSDVKLAGSDARVSVSDDCADAAWTVG